jgi:hypothetical protein
LSQDAPPCIWICQKIDCHRYCSLGVFFSPASENTDITREHNEVGTDLHDPISIHFGISAALKNVRQRQPLRFREAHSNSDK